ncbi:MAG: hypothetical protein WBA66_14765 [Xanthobacteraceae bacterium]
MAKTAKSKTAKKATRTGRATAARKTSTSGRAAKSRKSAASAAPRAAKKTRKITRREWTKDDVRELKSLARQRTPVAKIAKALKRTPGATAAKAFKLGVSLDTRR